ncbi:MAG: hypothetical protein NT019_00475 [Candidatus Adlerbacteria bacterium]|nr:hypothetical protein [Candidatus Adlerbacteria bacterium]
MRNNNFKYTKHIFAFLLLCVPTIAFGVKLVGNVKFAGNLAITGALSKGSGTFVIDHPLDPTNKLLFHSFVESPDVKNIYDGIATLDDKGEVIVQLPEYFDALNKDFRYQFFPLEHADPNIYLKVGADKTKNQFTIAGGTPGARVSWQVTGIRHDPYILANPIVPEVEKTDTTLVKKGEYLFEGYEK